ncbi:hypothetical protein DCE79_02615 [Lysinibacillus sp. 2017]|uniref:hypothetical protein n=1 Tax=unclassified Lysinibacillus TaxID=2636778 RepID=UPI000D528CB8|nr:MULTISPECIES: hypothetical protein [unclassified Lysinibacillus]AWE06344.1 hypothetical protein DCE79_02615 [Lysinibacillus sp. 2017]TGN35036.1 hypothetical protein E4L99_11785 [Lysinibacillus sp. S2017]
MEIQIEFEKWLVEEGRANVGDVDGFRTYLDEKTVGENKLLSRFSFVHYKKYLMDEGFAIATINKKINSLEVYNDFLQTKGLVNESHIQLKHDRVKIASGSEQMVTALSDEEVEKLLFYVETHKKVSQKNYKCQLIYVQKRSLNYV